MNKIYRSFKNKNSIWKFTLLKPFLKDGDTILDFGCGDLGLSNQIARNIKNTKITGIDVIPLKKTFKKNKNVNFIMYDGKKLPFKKNQFDVVIAFYVLHHCENPEAIIKECIRVVKKRLIIVESIPVNSYEIPFMKFFDWIFNVIKFDKTPLPYNFYKLSKWKKILNKNRMIKRSIKHPRSYEDYLPFGKLYILEYEKLI